MQFRSLPIAVAATLALGSMGISTLAAAQDQGPAPAARPAPPPGGYCRPNDHTGATVVGGLAGAAIGSNLAAHHGGRLGGALLGGLVGAVIGHKVGEDNGPPCAGGGYGYGYGYAYYPHHYYHPHYYRSYYGYGGPAYVYGAPPPVVVTYAAPPPPPYGAPPPPPPGYDAPRARAGGDCKTVQSNVQMPDGRSEPRDVRVCKDETGRYRVVD
jgi:hypothetical protein